MASVKKRSVTLDRIYKWLDVLDRLSFVGERHTIRYSSSGNGSIYKDETPLIGFTSGEEDWLLLNLIRDTVIERNK